MMEQLEIMQERKYMQSAARSYVLLTFFFAFLFSRNFTLSDITSIASLILVIYFIYASVVSILASINPKTILIINGKGCYYHKRGLIQWNEIKNLDTYFEVPWRKGSGFMIFLPEKYREVLKIQLKDNTIYYISLKSTKYDPKEVLKYMKQFRKKACAESL
jgi:hypothetical protein